MRRIVPAIGVCALLVGCGGPTPPPFKPVVDTKLLMQAVVDPNADAIWDSVKTIDTKEGSQDFRPRTEEEWTAVRNAAISVAEAGNLLMLVPRAKDGGEWMKRAQEMIDTGEAAIRAAEAKNADRLFTVGGDIYETCSNCHRQYMDAIVNANK
jgi:hypothetical protein